MRPGPGSPRHDTPPTERAQCVPLDRSGCWLRFWFCWQRAGAFSAIIHRSKSVSAPTFANPGTAQSPLFGQISLQRGYVLVDATLDGVPLQFVSTHLDGGLTSAEPAEINEILTGLGTAGQPQLVVGDFNATPSDLCAGLPCGPAELLAAGFTDTGAGLGPTCCQSPDLSNPASMLDRSTTISSREDSPPSI